MKKMSNRQQYQKFCESAADLPVFMQWWYLDAVCAGGGEWDAVVIEKGDRAVAALPYFLKKKWWWQHVAMPPLAKMLGAYLLPEFRTTRHEIEIYRKIIAELPPRLAAFEQDCNYHFQNWLPFFWKGFRQTTRYSYSLEINDLKQVFENFYPDYRNQKIPKAAAATVVEVVLPEQPSGVFLEEFFRVHSLSFSRQDLPSPVSFDFLERLDSALVAHRSRAIFFAKDRSTGETHSVAYLIWDSEQAWYLLAGDDPSLRGSGAGILLAWEAIQFSHNILNLKHFDFAGSMVEGIERVRRQFGAVPRPYFRLMREWSPIWRVGKMFLR